MGFILWGNPKYEVGGSCQCPQPGGRACGRMIHYHYPVLNQETSKTYLVGSDCAMNMVAPEQRAIILLMKKAMTPPRARRKGNKERRDALAAELRSWRMEVCALKRQHNELRNSIKELCRSQDAKFDAIKQAKERLQELETALGNAEGLLRLKLDIEAAIGDDAYTVQATNLDVLRNHHQVAAEAYNKAVK